VTKVLPGNIMDQLCQVADVAIEVTMELDKQEWVSCKELRLFAAIYPDNDVNSRAELVTGDFSTTSLRLEVEVRPKDRDLEIWCSCLAAYKDAPKITSGHATLIIKRRATDAKN